MNTKTFTSTILGVVAGLSFGAAMLLIGDNLPMPFSAKEVPPKYEVQIVGSGVGPKVYYPCDEALPADKGIQCFSTKGGVSVYTFISTVDVASVSISTRGGE